ncbi:hypothetical protein DsansV1_C10g0097241 [Dioscorea sansibarensis]
MLICCLFFHSYQHAFFTLVETAELSIFCLLWYAHRVFMSAYGMLRISPQVPSSMGKDLQVNKIEQGIAQIPPEVPSSVDIDLQVNQIDQIDNSDTRVSDFSWDGLILESAETGQAGNES